MKLDNQTQMRTTNNELLAYETDAGSTRTIFGYGHQRLSQTTPSGQTFFHSDLYGSPLFAADSQGTMQHYAERDIWGDLRPGTEIPSGLEENLRFTSYRYDPVIGKYFAQARFYDSANGRMLSKDPVKRNLNRYRYCDNDPADYVDPTGEIAHILWGIGLGGAFGFGGGFLSSAVSQKASGGEIDWKEALGSGINGLITGATQGGLLASGAGIPAALFANTLAGTAGSAAEQYIGSGKIDARKSITSGLNNAVSNAIYGTRPLGSMKEAFGRGVGAGAATSALNYISDTLGEKTLHSRMGMGLLSGMTGAAFSPYNFLRNPRRGCGSPSPFVPSLGYGSARGYQYDLPKIENGSQSQTKKFSLGDFLREVAIGGITGGLSSAAFYGAGKGIERLIDGLRKDGINAAYIPRDAEGNPIPLNKQTVNGQDIPLPDPAAGGRSHTILGGKVSSETGNVYRQSATFPGGTWPTVNGQDVPWSEVHWTDHGTPHHHTNPHQHIFEYNPDKGGWIRKGPTIFEP